jgi:4-hydroxy-2-oxoheptanedioate aldolase
VRVDHCTKPMVQHILDAGAAGVMFPQINTAEEAEYAVRAMYYPPTGTRGVARSVRATGYGKYFDQYADKLPNLLTAIVQIETLQALDNVEAIAALSGVDALFVGPSDLSMSLGIFQQFDHPDFQQAIDRVMAAAAMHKKVTGLLLPDIAHYAHYHQKGFRLMACGSDNGFLRKGAADMAVQMSKMVDW